MGYRARYTVEGVITSIRRRHIRAATCNRRVLLLLHANRAVKTGQRTKLPVTHLWSTTGHPLQVLMSMDRCLLSSWMTKNPQVSPIKESRPSIISLRIMPNCYHDSQETNPEHLYNHLSNSTRHSIK